MASSKESSYFSEAMRGTPKAAPTYSITAFDASDKQDSAQVGTPGHAALLDTGPIGSVTPVSSSKTAAASSPLLANETLAANLATAFPRTPQKRTPNSGRKRRYMPNLSRPLASPSHGTRMSMMFQNAASVLQSTTPPPRQASPNTKKSRLPISQARSIKFGEANYHKRDKISNPGNLHSSFDNSAVCNTRMTPHESLPLTSITRGRQSPNHPTTTTADLFTYDYLPDHFSPPRDGERLTLPRPRRYIGSPSQVEALAPEPISSGFATPAATTRQISNVLEEIRCPGLEHRKKPFSASSASSVGSGSDDQSSSHSFRVITPFSHLDAEKAQHASINAWLTEVMGVANDSVKQSNEPSAENAVNDVANVPAASPIASQRIKKPTAKSPAKPLPDFESSSKASSNKENVAPKYAFHPPIRQPIQEVHISTPTRFRSTAVPSIKPDNANRDSPTRFKPPPTLQGHLALPPKRKKARVVSNQRADLKPLSPSNNFTIHDEELAEALAKLSPSVEPHRKGRRPKRERCVSYWDDDILTPGSASVEEKGGRMGEGVEDEDEENQAEGTMLRNGKVVLGEIEMSEEADGETGFVAEAREQGKAEFNFRA